MSDSAHPIEMNTLVLTQKVDAVVWGLFFLWVGVALLAGIGWGLGLLGVGVLTLGTQLVRRSFGLMVEAFWVVVGVLFLLGGVWELFSIRIGLAPVLLIIAGIALLASAARRPRDVARQ